MVRNKRAKKSHLILIDMMSVESHCSLNNFYLKILNVYNPVLYISENLREMFGQVTTQAFGKKPCGSKVPERLVSVFRVLVILTLRRPTQVVFLSYDLLGMPIISWLASILKVKLVFFEHNTAPSSTLKCLFHRLVKGKVKRLVYTEHIVKQYNRINVNAVYVPHPCVRPKKDKEGDCEWDQLLSESHISPKNFVFCPSGSVDLRSIEGIAVDAPEDLFICKSQLESELPNVITRRFFRGYYQALSKCSFVAVFFPHDTKVSGPAFEALSMGKPLMVLKNNFGFHLKALFPSLVFFPGEELPSPAKINLRKHNEMIESRIAKTLELSDKRP